ncbi:hypothetical protein WCD74_26050 [Actinomycetospora sp. OC33-EN08]|uniref:Lipoprotein n=1 Tax=Actinomycetospora aurantiaca TaxID=3129233 RepID=A0ABU8MVB1_9PSEU
MPSRLRRTAWLVAPLAALVLTLGTACTDSAPSQTPEAPVSGGSGHEHREGGGATTHHPTTAPPTTVPPTSGHFDPNRCPAGLVC